MNRLKSTLLFVLLAVVTTAGIFFQSTPVAAEGSAALSITPKKNYTVEPGKTVNDTLMIRNLDREQSLFISLRVVDFTFNDETGTPKLMLADDAPQTTWSMKPFLKLPKSVTVEPNSSVTVDMSIAIPENQGAGSYYSAIVYSTGASDGGNVGLSASGVTLAFTSIPGTVDEKLTLEKLGTYNASAKKYTYLNMDEPQRIAYTIKNEGNVTASPVGSITLKHLFGKETVINNINPNQSLALIGQTRRFESCIKLKKDEVDFNGSRTEATTCASPSLWPGYYSVEMNAFYGRNGNATRDLIGKGSFWYLPMWFIIIALIVLLFIAYHIWRIVRFFKKRQQGGGVKFKKRSSRR